MKRAVVLIGGLAAAIPTAGFSSASQASDDSFLRELAGIEEALRLEAAQPRRQASSSKKSSKKNSTAQIAAQQELVCLGHEEAYAAARARLDGRVPDEYVREVFSSPHVEIIPRVVSLFRPPKIKAQDEKPRPPQPPGAAYKRYRAKHITPESVSRGLRLYREQKILLAGISSRYGVDPFILVGLVGIESRFGTYHPFPFPVFNAFYTMLRCMPERSEFAQREMAAFLEMGYRNEADPECTMGSYAGAIGYGQFLPSSYQAYAVDYDGDGYKSFEEWPDVFASVSNYLVKNGYQRGGSFASGSANWFSILAYNRDARYARVVIEMGAEIRKADQKDRKAAKPAGYASR